VGNITGNFLINLFLVNQKGLSIIDIGNLGTVSLIVNLPGSFLAAYALDRWDVRWLIFWMNITTAMTTAAVVWTPFCNAFEYNVALNLVGSLTGQAAQTLIAGVALRIAPPKMGASFLSVIATVQCTVGVAAQFLGGFIATIVNDPLSRYQISFVAGAVIIAFGCLFVPWLGDSARPPKEEPAAGASAPPAIELGPAGGGSSGGGGGSVKAVSSPNPLAAAVAAAAAAEAAGSINGSGAKGAQA
jgi:MFS family permease